MKTWQAFLAHAGIAALQAMTAAPLLDGHNTTGALANAGVQIGVQTGLLVLQALVTRQNSNSDPKGNPLAETSPGSGVFKTVPAPEPKP